MAFTGLAVVCLRGFFSRVAIFLGLVFGYGISWAFDRIFGPDPLDERERRGHRHCG